VNAYNEAVGSFESRVVPQLRRIEEAGAGSEREVELVGIEEAPRALTRAIAADDDDDDERARVAQLRSAQELEPPQLRAS